MSDLSKRMRNLRERATQGEWYEIETSDGESLSAMSVECDSTDMETIGPLPNIGGIDPNITICLTMLQSPRAVQHQSGKAYRDAEFIAEAANEMYALCDEIEALEKEVARLRGRHE